MQSIMLNAQIFGASNNLRKSLLSNSVGYTLADDSVANNTATILSGQSRTFEAASNSPSILYLVTTAPVTLTISRVGLDDLVINVKKICILDCPFSQIQVAVPSNSTQAIVHIVQG